MLIIAFLLFGLAAPDAIAVIVNRSNPIAEMSVDDLARVYCGQEAEWRNGSKIVVVNRPASEDIRKYFYRKVLGVDPYHKYYLPGSPVPFKTSVQVSAAAVKLYVSRVPQAIGYIWLSEVDDTVQVLKLDRVLPTQVSVSNGEYPLSLSNIRP